MNSRQWLEQVLILEQTMRANRSEYDWLEAVSTASGAINYQNDRTIGSAPTSSRFESAVINKEYLRKVIEEEYDQLLKMHTDIRKVIFAVADADAQNALRMKYLSNKDLDLIAYEYHVSRKTIERRLDRGYIEVARLTGYPAPIKQRMPAQERHHIARTILKEVYEEKGE